MTPSACSASAADQWKLWVHIADVSHYVKPGTAWTGSAQARQLDLPGGPRHSDAAGGVEQRTLFAQAERGSPDQMRGVSGLRRRPGAEDAVLFRGDPFQAPLHLQGSAWPILQRQPADAIERMLHDAHELAQRIRRAAVQGRLARSRFSRNENPAG